MSLLQLPSFKEIAPMQEITLSIEQSKKIVEEGEILMNRPQEQISYSGYMKDTLYWEDYAKQIGRIEVCDDETGEPIFVIA